MPTHPLISNLTHFFYPITKITSKDSNSETNLTYLGYVWYATVNHNGYEFDSSGGPLAYDRVIPPLLDSYGVWIISMFHSHVMWAPHVNQTLRIITTMIPSFP